MVLASAAQAATPEPAAARAYVSRQGGGVEVIDLATWQPLGDIDAHATEQRGIGVTSDGRMLVTANRDDGNISVIDRASGRLLRQVAIGANPEFVRTLGHRAFVSFEPSSTGAPPPAAAASAGAGEDDDAARQPAHIAIVDLDRGRILREITGGPETEGIEFSADARRLLVTNESDNTVTVHDIASGQRLASVDLSAWGTRPRGIKRAPDGRHYVVTLEHGNAFVVLDDRYRVIRSVPTGESPYGVAFDRRGERLFVAAARARRLEVFDAHTWAPIGSAPLGERCWHFSFTPDDRHLLVACGRSNEVLVIDAQTLQPTQHLSAASLPWGIVTFPKSVGSLDSP